MASFLAAPFMLIANVCMWCAAIITGNYYQITENLLIEVDEETGGINVILISMEGDDDYNDE